MNERPSAHSLRPSLSKEVARGLVRSFEDRFKRHSESEKAHLYLAYHAAFPLTLTPDLLYSLCTNFSHYNNNEPFTISWIAVADLLLSSLCNEVGQELYEIDVSVRNVLLEELKAHPRFNEQRIHELSNFLFAYMQQQQLHGHQPFNEAFDRVHKWTALAYTDPTDAALQLAEALRASLEQHDTTEQIRLTALIETFAEPFTSAGLAPLITYVYRIARFVRLDERSPSALHDTEETTRELRRILQIRLPTLAQIQKEKTKSETRAAASSNELPVQQSGGKLALPAATNKMSLSQGSEYDSWYSDYAIELYKRAKPKIKGICPSCTEEISFGECRIVSGREPGKELKKVPTDWWERRLANRNPEPLYTPNYRQELAHRECPNCGYLLPYNVELVDNTLTLAIIGDPFSGKSHYIASLLYQIRQEWLPQVMKAKPASFTSLTSDVEKIYKEEILEPLFIEKRILPTTSRDKEENHKPLIYELIIGTSTTNLIIYDTSGEHFEIPEEIVRFARYIFNASAFIFVADPVKMPYVFERLPPNLQARLQREFSFVRQRRTADMINNVLSLYERYHGYQDGAGPYPRTAIMVSKSDLIQSITSKPYTFTKRSAYEDKINLQDLALVNKEVRELLKEYQQGDLLVTTNRFEQSYLFATSATGEQPDEQYKLTNVEPRRCLDPLLWILYHLNIIQTNE